MQTSDDNNYSRSAGWANSIYREKNLGSITNANVGTFIANHIQGDTFIDIHPGDYVTIMDGTYNAIWVIVGLDTEFNKGDTPLTTHQIGLIPRSPLFTAPMNSSNVTTGGYYGSAMRTSTLQTVATNLKNALGSRLLSRRVLLSNAVNNDAYSMAGINWKGSSSSWEWCSEYCTLMSEVQVYGSTVFSSSGYDVGEASSQLPYFTYVNYIKAGKIYFWLRAVASATEFAVASGSGGATLNGAGSDSGVRPLICIG